MNKTFTIIIGTTVFLYSWKEFNKGYNNNFWLNFGNFGVWLTILGVLL